MAINITMPKWGLTMKQGKVTRWFKAEGDTVAKGERLFEVETEKITNVVEAAAGGVLFQIVVTAGSIVQVGTVVAVIAQAGETPKRIEGLVAGEADAAAPASAAAAAGADAGEPEKGAFVAASPAARRLARELKVSLSRVPGTGPGGRVTEGDVKRFHEQGPRTPGITPLAEEMARQAGLDIAGLTGTGEGGKITKADVERALRPVSPDRPEEGTEPVRVIPFTGMRRSIADNMMHSLASAAQLTAFVEVDVTESMRFLDRVRKAYQKDEAARVSLNDIIILAVSRALRRHPILNSNLVGEEILIFEPVNMGVAVALDEGLMVPVLKDADKKGLMQIAREVRMLAQKARQGVLEVDEVTGGTFTVTNVGMFQVDGFTPILKPPETGILGVGRVKTKPAAHEGGIALREMMFLSLTFDHQVVDGAPANAFLQTVVQYLEQPTLIMT